MAKFGVSEKHNENVEFALKEAADLLKDRLGDKWGFTILGFNFGPGGDMFYISNGQRDDVLDSMREFIAKNAPNPKDTK